MEKKILDLSVIIKRSTSSPVAMEIVLQAYNTDRTVSEFSNYWFEKCQEIDCNEFWADLEVATKLVSE